MKGGGGGDTEGMTEMREREGKEEREKIEAGRERCNVDCYALHRANA